MTGKYAKLLLHVLQALSASGLLYLRLDWSLLHERTSAQAVYVLQNVQKVLSMQPTIKLISK